jgi:hypothetical protein
VLPYTIAALHLENFIKTWTVAPLCRRATIEA